MTTIDIKLPKRLEDQLTMPPCVDFRLPKPTLPELTLPTGGTLKGIADLTKGVPSDCSLNFNLIIQLAPILASMQCLFEVLKLLGALKKFFEAAKDPVRDPTVKEVAVVVTPGAGGAVLSTLK